MNRILASLSTAALLTASAAAQCLTGLGAATPTGVVGDDLVGATHYALGLTYPNPVGGALAGGYTHVRVSTNGCLMLTDGTLSTGIPANASYGSTANTSAGLGGGAGSFPLIAPWWGDANITGTGNIYVLPGVPGVSPAEITWFDTSDFSFTTVKKTVKVKIYDDGVGSIEFEYGTPFAKQGSAARYVGVSTRNGIATVPPQTNLGVPGASSGTSGMCFKTFATAAVNLEDHTIRFVQNGTGGWDVIPMCGTPLFPPPSAVSVGTGCYSIPNNTESFYQLFPLAANAQTTLEGNTMTLTPAGSGYAAVWSTGTAATAYVAPGSAPASTGVVTLPTTDDGTTIITPSVPLSTPFGTFATLTVAHNGVIFMGSGGTAGATASAATFATNTAGGFYSWADFNDTPTTSGKIKTEEGTVGPDQVLFVTWDGVWRWASPAVASPSTLQFQLNLTTGVVTYVWLTMDPQDISTFDLQLVGYSDPGASNAGPGIDLPTALPIVTTPDIAAVLPMAMSVSALPGLTPSGDTVPMTWTVTNVPEATQIAPTVRACNIVFSIAPAFVAGIDLGAVITPANGPSGCNGYVLTADAFVDVSALNGTGICTSPAFVFSPPPSLIGAVITTQAIAVAPAGVYNGLTNDIDGTNSLWSSNAVQQTYNPL